MKNFVNCTPDEFMAQAVKIRTPFVEWVKEVGIPEIRKRRPEGYDKMEQKEKVEAVTRMANENMCEILAIALEKNAEATKNLLCLATFTKPEDFNKHTMVEYLAAVTEMLSNSEVRGFFTLYLSPMLKGSSKG